MVHAVELHAGRAVRYRNRWVTTDNVARTLGTDPIPGPPAAAVDIVATNVITFGGRTLALGPGALAYELDDQLATLGRVDLAGHGRGIGAHPQIDPLTGALHLVSYGDEPAHHIVSPNSHTRITVPVPDAPGPLQDVLLTRERFVLLGEGFVGITDRTGQAAPRWVETPTSPAPSPPATSAGDVAVVTASRSLVPMDLQRGRRPPRRPRRHTPALRHHQPRTGLGPHLPVDRRRRRRDRRCTATTCAPATGPPMTSGPAVTPARITFVPDPTRLHREDGGWLVGFVHDDNRNEADLIVLDAAAIDRPAGRDRRDPSTHPLRAPRHVDPGHLTTTEHQQETQCPTSTTTTTASSRTASTPAPSPTPSSSPPSSRSSTTTRRQFIEARAFFFLSTVNGDGHPTVSHKGGAPGFVRVVDPTTIVFPSYDGNGMFLSMGNIANNGRIGLLFMDFNTPHRIRAHANATLSYSMRRPLIALEITSCWICSVPSKMSMILASRWKRSTGYSRT